MTGHYGKEPDQCSLLLSAHRLNQIKVMSLIPTRCLFMLGHSEATKGSPQSETDISVQTIGKTSQKDHEEPLEEQPSVTGTQ